MSYPHVVEAIDLHKTFDDGVAIEVLQGINLQVDAGETLAIMGKSGEGKSTLLHILGALDTPTSGSLRICGKSLKDRFIASLRNQHIGFIFQAYHLLEDFTVLDNVVMPLRIKREKNISLEERGMTLLKEVGLEKKKNSLAKTLSGGEKQRVAIARALCNKPDLLLADEPTGNLDKKNSENVQALLLDAAKKSGAALVIVTHDMEFAKQCDRSLLLKEGQLYTK